MIEFRLKVDSRITRGLAPLIVKCFSECRNRSLPAFPYLDEKDGDLVDSWESSLGEDFAQDRQALARLLNSSKFAHGYVEMEENDAELVLRSITEIRMHVREQYLGALTDVELETGDVSFSQKSSSIQPFYLIYLVLAEVQEGLIQEII
ncbi:MAG: hypothetical protein O2908_03880 [Verrucomicrobia bacterium]|jgi:hypothetical protein|nr:hypothetical protein [Verrucomicrobiota bacterium]MDA1078167.1 hypothetical protein [Verrucomicrobiota bacterium]NDH17571.1 hypothetical protein [Opitutae bacterium]